MSEDDWKGWEKAAQKEAKGIKEIGVLEKGQGHCRVEGKARNPLQDVNQLLAQVYYYTAVTSPPHHAILSPSTSQQIKNHIPYKTDIATLHSAGFSHES